MDVLADSGILKLKTRKSYDYEYCCQVHIASLVKTGARI